MKIFHKVSATLAILLSLAAPSIATAKSPGKVLVVMSGGHLLPLKEKGKVYATGYYLNELYVPLAALVNAGYTPVFANPNGDTPSMDASSNDDKFFGGDATKRMQALQFIEGQPGIHHPLKLSTIVGHTHDYAGVFVPGGHAPMIDLTTSKDLGAILKSFHEEGKPTALICHGPIVLLSSLPESKKFDKVLLEGNAAEASKYSKGWIYNGYKVSVFSKIEEQQIEVPQLGGHLAIYNEDALTAAGAKITNGEPWKSNVIQDKELITAQQPFSDHAFADAFLSKLK